MIYLHHIRKTGGRSLICSILGTVGDAWEGYCQVCRSPSVLGGKLFEGWRAKPSVDAYFAWSHQAAWQVRIPEDAFTVTIIRDPVMRLISHYRMLLIMQHQGETRFDETEMTWMGQDILEFAEKMPREHLQRQLYMFSKQYSIVEAAERIRALSFYFRLEEYVRGLAELGRLLEMDLKEYHITGRGPTNTLVETRIQDELTPHVRETLRDLLAPEFELLDML